MLRHMSAWEWIEKWEQEMDIEVIYLTMMQQACFFKTLRMEKDISCHYSKFYLVFMDRGPLCCASNCRVCCLLLLIVVSCLVLTSKAFVLIPWNTILYIFDLNATWSYCGRVFREFGYLFISCFHGMQLLYFIFHVIHMFWRLFCYISCVIGLIQFDTPLQPTELLSSTKLLQYTTACS